VVQYSGVLKDTGVFPEKITNQISVEQKNAKAETYSGTAEEQTAKSTEISTENETADTEVPHGYAYETLTAEQKTQLEEEFHGRFTFQEDRDGFDYLYTVDKLADLAGKKLHAKRNHIHRFDEQFPDWLFEPIGPDNLAECVEMEAKWYAEQVEAGRADANLGHERDAVNTALSHMEELGISGGLIRAGGQVVAFSLGSLTTADCYNVHFEKAYGEIQGAYAVINREMARWVRSTFPQVAYLNREDDMGLEGLRKAKLSYYPDILLKKYSAREV